MQSTPKFLGNVHIWKDGDVWRWVPEGTPAPSNAILGKRYGGDGDVVIYVEHSDKHGEFIRGAVKSE